MRQWLVCLALVSVFGMAGCNRVNSKSSVEAAIRKHLNQNPHLMLNSFSTRFQKVAVHGDTADALVKFESKNSPNLSVEVSYVLKKANGTWQVVSSSSVNGQVSNPANPHAGVNLDQAPPPQGAPAPAPSH
ncbi:MAG: hypothetical protein ACRD4Q_10795 [Candidatus Acidiferrales bacterium]